MIRMLGSAAVLLFAVAVAEAHFPFIVPEPDGSSVKVVFSDELAPDLKVDIEKIAATKLTVRDTDTGKDVALTHKKGEGFLAAAVPGKGGRVVFGITDYGVLQKGDSKPFRLIYYPKAVLGAVPLKATQIGEPVKVEIVPETAAGKTRFRVLHDGKAVAESEYTVIVPGAEKKAGKTDKEGYTEAFSMAGRYGVFARVTEVKAGEFAGKKFEETRNYATLVIDLK